MKHLIAFTVLVALLLVAVPALAQSNSDVIILNDATPAIDVIITLPQDTTGTISMDLVMAQVLLTDEAGNTVFYSADERLHALEFNLAPNSGSHTLTVERLPGVAEASVRVRSLPEMTINGVAELVGGSALTLNQEIALTLDAASPGGAVNVSLPPAAPGVLTATFPGANARTQLVDAGGLVLAESVGGHIDGLSLLLDGGDYTFTLLGSGLIDAVVAGVRAIPVDASGFTLLESPAAPAVVDTLTTAGPATTANSGAAAETCTATVLVSSVNLRSGPGTGYSIIDYGYRNETYPIGGHNPENNWIVVGTPTGSAWMTLDAAQLNGPCISLPVFDIPLRDAQPAQIVISAPQQSSGDDDDHEYGEYEDHDDDDHEEDGEFDEGGEQEDD